MISESRCPACRKQRLMELEALAAVRLLEDFSLEEDELFKLRSCAEKTLEAKEKGGTIDWGEPDAPVPTDDLEL
jgi:hypothetical protein